MAKEIEVRRHLLHGFVKDAAFLRNVIERGAQHPEEYAYIKNGSIEFFPKRRLIWQDPEHPNRAMWGAPGFGDLTFAALVPHLGDFFDSTKESLLWVPIEPSVKPPQGYQVEMTLIFVLGGGGHGAYLKTTLYSQQKQRYFSTQICHDRLKSRYWESAGYQSWKSIRRRAADLQNERAALLASRLKINEKTTGEMIWVQLLLSALGQDYLGQDEGQAEMEFKQLVCRYVLRKPEALTDELENWSERETTAWDISTEIWSNFKKKRPYPYTPQSLPAYLRKLKKGFRKNLSSKGLALSYQGLEGRPARKQPSAHELFNTVADMEQRLGISRKTIYRLIKQGKVQATAEGEGLLRITRGGRDELERMRKQRERRNAIYDVAEKKGKTRETTKKWLTRHRDLPDDEYREQLAKWLGMKGGKVK